MIGCRLKIITTIVYTTTSGTADFASAAALHGLGALLSMIMKVRVWERLCNFGYTFPLLIMSMASTGIGYDAIWSTLMLEYSEQLILESNNRYPFLGKKFDSKGRILHWLCVFHKPHGCDDEPLKSLLMEVVHSYIRQY